MPYSEEDGPYFFGREQEKNIVIGNLIASRLTLLYGVSGSGKSSLLRAGVSYELRQLAQRQAADNQTPESIIALFSTWRDDPVNQLLSNIRHAIIRDCKVKPESLSSKGMGLLETLQAWTREINTDVLVVLDQFEEFFLYHPQEKPHSFEWEFARVINHRDLRVNFLISIREDALAKLDRFKGHIPELFNNYLRIERLNRSAAHKAITKPLTEYNRHLPEDKSVDIEPSLVSLILDQVRANRDFLRTGKGRIDGDRVEEQIELPYLQLVMTRLWTAEIAADSRLLRLETLNRLGGAERIVRSHLDERMELFSKSEKVIAATIFDHLVTPSGSKIAHTARDLSGYAKQPETVVRKVLEDLAGGDVRILRTVLPPVDQPQETRYEVYHDVLALAILDWRQRFMDAEKEAIKASQQEQELYKHARAEQQRQEAVKTRRRMGTTATKSSVPAGHGITLDIELLSGSITDVSSPAVVVGHYKEAAISFGALGSIDAALDYWISDAHEHRIIGGDLGELFLIPVNHRQVQAQTVVLAGMGQAGKFSYHAARYLIQSVTYALASLGYTEFGTVLIGSGSGGLDIETATKATVSGAINAISRLPLAQQSTTIKLVEFEKERSRAILTALERTAASLESSVQVRIRESKLRPRRRRPTVQAVPGHQKRRHFGPRITIERGASAGFAFSALTASAVVPERQVDVKSFFVEGISAQLVNSESPKDQEKSGLLLTNYFFPKDLDVLLDSGGPLTLTVDLDTCALPWEMACYRKNQRTLFFGRDLQLARQFRTERNSYGIEAPRTGTTKILVIGDPAKEPELHLAGAHKEAQIIVETLERLREGGNFDCQVMTRIGAEECNPNEILSLLINETFDVVHFTGYSTFNPMNPNFSGWVFGRDVVLSPHELFRTRQVPRLIFASTAYSAILNSGVAPTAEESMRGVGHLANAFFQQGLRNFIGTGWSVDDAAAFDFVRVFYESVSRGLTLGEAIAEGRVTIFHAGSSWGAYQHYGEPNTLLC